MMKNKTDKNNSLNNLFKNLVYTLVIFEGKKKYLYNKIFIKKITSLI
jgi:hypothetical protein